MNELEPLLNEHEVASYLGLKTPKTVQRWAREGKIRGIHVGDLWRFRKQDIQNFLDLNTNK